MDTPSSAQSTSSIHRAPCAVEGVENFESIESTIFNRTNSAARRLTEPGPSPEQLNSLMSLVAAAPDHGQLIPWRFVLVPSGARERLGTAFVSALLQRDPSATTEKIERAREKAFHAPVLILAVAVDREPVSDIPERERLVSLGAAIQNMLLGATAMGFGSALASGQAMDSLPVRELFSLSYAEKAVCFIAFGTAQRRKPRLKARPDLANYFTELHVI